MENLHYNNTVIRDPEPPAGETPDATELAFAAEIEEFCEAVAVIVERLIGTREKVRDREPEEQGKT